MEGKVVRGRARSVPGGSAKLLGRIGLTDETSRQGLIKFLRAPRYEVLPTEDVEDLVLAQVPHEVTVTITASPRRGIEATMSLAERLAGHGYQVVPHISALLIKDEAHRRGGVQLPIQLGLAGGADPAKLLRVSTRIGLADSARFLRGHSNWFMRLVQPGGYDPERFATGLLPDLAAPDRNVAGLHFFTFNEIEATERWRRETLARLLAS